MRYFKAVTLFVILALQLAPAWAIICPECGKENEDTNNYCNWCAGVQLDNDGDGVFNQNDKCPNEPEDFDGWEDEDGCPDEDNDGDYILDINDKCPNEPETFNGYQDEDGCPDTKPVSVVDVEEPPPVEKPVQWEPALRPFHIHLGGGWPFAGDISLGYAIHDNGYLGASVSMLYIIEEEQHLAKTGDLAATLDYDLYLNLDFFPGKMLHAHLGLGGGVFLRAGEKLLIAKLKVGAMVLFSRNFGVTIGLDYYPIMGDVYLGEALNLRAGLELFL